MPKFWEKCKISYFWAILGQKSAIMAQIRQIRFFQKNRAPSLFKLDHFATSCKKLGNLNEPISRKAHNKRTDELTDKGTNRHRLIYTTFTCRRSKNWMLSYPNSHHFVSSGKKSEKINDPILRKAPDKRTDERTDERTRVNL